MPRFSTVIINFNSIGFIKSCLDSVFTQNCSDFEVILVDNGSKDGTLGFVKENYPNVRLIENKVNLGAAKARNQGIEIAKGEWILVLDCDVILENNFLSKILEVIGNLSPKAGIIQPKILKADRKTIYSCGIRLSNLRRFHDIGKGRPNSIKFDKVRHIFGACAAAALYKRQMLEQIKENTGYFDERFFFLVEDVDLAWRAQKRGWRTLFFPQAICYHFGNSSGYSKKIRQYLCFRNRYFLILKNDNIYTFRNIILILVYDLPRLFCLMLTNNYIWKALREIKIALSKIDHSNYVH